MKNLVIISSLAAVIGSVTMANAASTGTITFSGELTATTCDVVVDGQTADATVVLPKVGISQLNAATKTAGDTGFAMSLNNCTGTLQSASAFFNAGASVNPTTGRLNNMTGTATNVSLQLLDASSPSMSPIQAGNLNQVTNTTYKNISSGSVTLPYTVRYYAEAPTTAGTVVSNVVYNIQYQ